MSLFFKEEAVTKVIDNITARRAAALAAAAVLGLSGCATQAPMLTPQARSHYDASHQKVSQSGVAVLVDSCLYRLEVGTSHVLPALSQAHARKLQLGLVHGLEGQGVSVKQKHSPFVCSNMKEDYLLTLKQADQPGGELKPITSYPFKATGNAWQASEDAQVLALLGQVRELPVTVDRAPDAAIKPVPLDLSQEQAQALVELLGAPYVWVADVRQQDVSLGRTIGLVALTAGLTAGATGGAYASWSTHEDAYGELVALVDLEKRELLWKRQLIFSQRGIVDFERPLPTDEQMKHWAVTGALVPFYEPVDATAAKQVAQDAVVTESAKKP